MATNKNFTMQQYNGTDYDVLYPKNTSQQTLLNDSALATALGITATSPEIDQALTEIVNKITALENGAVKIQTGSYVGTGTYGASNPCSLTFLKNRHCLESLINPKEGRFVSVYH